MDFAAMLTPVRFGKAAAPEETGVPSPLRRKQSASRRLAAIKEVRQLIGMLPGPGESLHGIIAGRWDFTDLLDVALEQTGPVEYLRLSTLSYNARSINCFVRWLQAGKVKSLAVLFSKFFTEHNPALVDALRDALREAGPQHRMASARTHAKLVTMHATDGRKWAWESSANARSNANAENFAVTADDALHDFYAAWIDEEIERHGSSENR